MSPRLYKPMHSTFAKAKRCFRVVTVLQWLLAALGGYVILARGDSTPVVIAVFVCSLLSIIVQQIGKAYYTRGEVIRRAHMLEEGLGIPPSESELLDILSKEPAPAVREPKPIEGYYSAVTPTGLHRFLHQLHESAFWTSALARLAAFVNYAVSGIGLTATLIMAFVLMRTGKGAQPQSPDYAKLFMNLLIFFLAGSTLTAAGSYRSLSAEAKRVADLASRMRKETAPELGAALCLARDYDVALAKALPLPSYAYKLLQAKLHAAWKLVCGNGGQSLP